jgi:fumarate reductase subunit D
MFKGISPILWFLFSAGGTVAALLFPVHVILLGLAIPLGWMQAPGYPDLLALVRHPVAKLYLFVLIALPLYHAAHRFRYTLYDGLKIKHLELLIVTMCYGTATVGSILAAITLWRL